MYFPEMMRRRNYKKKENGENYLTYSIYYDEIAEDCQYRCVYCDVMISELGGESMHLDHFCPQRHFAHLENDPMNLVLACPKCNQLKSDWWPEKDGTSQNGVNGFIDPFSSRRLDYFRVEESGLLVAIKPPSQYIIKLLALNRPTRCQIRRARRIKATAFKLLDQVIDEMARLSGASDLEIKEKLPILSNALAKIREMLQVVI
jgi:hypothetical protein